MSNRMDLYLSNHLERSYSTNMKCPLKPIPLPIGNSMVKESEKSDS